MISFRIFNTACFSMPNETPALSCATRPLDRATAAPHGNTTRCYRRSGGPQRQTRRAGGVERSLLGDGLLGPRERSGTPGRVQKCTGQISPAIWQSNHCINAIHPRHLPIIISHMGELPPHTQHVVHVHEQIITYSTQQLMR